MAALSLICALLAVSRAGDVSAVQVASDVSLVFEYSNSSEEKSRTLFLELPTGRTKVSTRDSAEPVIVTGHIMADTYEEMELVAASSEKGVLAVAFKLSPGYLRRVPAHYLSPYNFTNPRGVTATNDYLVRTFVNEGGQWSPHLTFYPATFYGDVTDETPRDIKVLGKDSINLDYDGTWRVFGGDKYSSDGPFKFKRKEGSTTRQFRYLPEKGILFAVNSEGSESHTDGSIWWTGIQDFESSDQSVRNQQFSLLIADQDKKLKTLGLTRNKPVYASPVPKEHFELFKELDKHLEAKELGERE